MRGGGKLAKDTSANARVSSLYVTSGWNIPAVWIGFLIGGPSVEPVRFGYINTRYLCRMVSPFSGLTHHMCTVRCLYVIYTTVEGTHLLTNLHPCVFQISSLPFQYDHHQAPRHLTAEQTAGCVECVEHSSEAVPRGSCRPSQSG